MKVVKVSKKNNQGWSSELLPFFSFPPVLVYGSSMGGGYGCRLFSTGINDNYIRIWKRL